MITNFPNNKFDIIICSDVLEHIENQEMAILEWKRILKKGGKVICFVPAFNFLWSKHDIENMHYRRYSKNKLCLLFEKNGYTILRSSYWNFLSFFPALIVRLFLYSPNKKVPGDQLYSVNNFLNSIIFNLLKAENGIILKGIDFPFGVSIFVIAKRI